MLPDVDLNALSTGETGFLAWGSFSCSECLGKTDISCDQYNNYKLYARCWYDQKYNVMSIRGDDDSHKPNYPTLSAAIELTDRVCLRNPQLVMHPRQKWSKMPMLRPLFENPTSG